MHRIINYRWFAFAVLFLCVAALSIQAETYSVKADSTTDSVYIKSKAKLEFFDGTGRDIVGSFQFDPVNPSAGATGILRFDLRTLNTGIELRNEHMQDRHLHTDKFPYCYYELISVIGLPNSITLDSTYHVSGSGFFYIHGVKRELPAEISFKQTASGYSVIATFAINLDEFEIPRPKALFMKLAEVIEVSTRFVGTSGGTRETVTLPTDWEELK